jgi:hypothetical protein
MIESNLEAVREADEGDDKCCCPTEEREAEAVEEEAEAKCFSTPLGVHWNRSELSDALSLDESGLGEAGAIQLADLAGRGPRGEALLEDEPAAACRLLEAEETRRGMAECNGDGGFELNKNNQTQKPKKMSQPKDTQRFTESKNHCFFFARSFVHWRRTAGNKEAEGTWGRRREETKILD